MMALVGQIKQSTQLRWNRVHKFKAKIGLNIVVGGYIIKTAETPEELIESFKLRHEVFNQEFRGMRNSGLDFDKFDYHFDHLIIVHRESQKIIGTYRMNCSHFSPESYTALEFDLQSLFREKGPFLELGRACIHKDYRKGSIISLLWRGIAEYMKLSGANILFGCSSLKINNAREAALVHKLLVDQGLVSSKYSCRPTKKFTMAGFKTWQAYFAKGLSEEQIKEAEELVPSLLKSYLKLGAVVACEPAFDEEFDCIDLLTVLRKEDLAESLATRFQVAR
jgi:L-ornithine Nalpha-acyltransferase